MNINIIKNKYINALLLVMLLSAIVHMGILAVIAFKTGNWALFNYLTIISVDYFFPNFARSGIGVVAAWAGVLALYIGFVLMKSNDEA